MTDFDVAPGVYTNDMGVGEGDSFSTSFYEWYSQHVEEKLEEAYQLGLLHGINASSMARVERDVMEFEDYKWMLGEQ